MTYLRKQRAKRKKRYGGNIALRLASILFGLVLITTWMMGGLLAKYVVTDSGEDSARVAAFVFRVQEELGRFEIPLDEMLPGDVKEYKFTVTNQTGSGLICETDQAYTIQMNLDGSLPLVCTLYQQQGTREESGKAQICQMDAMHVVNTEDARYSGQPVNMEAGNATSDIYLLTIEWPKSEERLQPIFAGGVAEVALQITSVQID